MSFPRPKSARPSTNTKRFTRSTASLIFSPSPGLHSKQRQRVLDISFEGEKKYPPRRIDFSGNPTTRDKVIRRELLIDEGQLFNQHAWEVSILRLNQLDYFEKLDADNAAEIKRHTKNGTVDILLKLPEKGKKSLGLQ